MIPLWCLVRGWSHPNFVFGRRDGEKEYALLFVICRVSVTGPHMSYSLPSSSVSISLLHPPPPRPRPEAPSVAAPSHAALEPPPPIASRWSMPEPSDLTHNVGMEPWTSMSELARPRSSPSAPPPFGPLPAHPCQTVQPRPDTPPRRKLLETDALTPFTGDEMVTHFSGDELVSESRGIFSYGDGFVTCVSQPNTGTRWDIVLPPKQTHP